MKQVTTGNPAISSSFLDVQSCFEFIAEGIPNKLAEACRPGSRVAPIAQARRKGRKQLVFDTKWAQDRVGEVLGRS